MTQNPKTKFTISIKTQLKRLFYPIFLPRINQRGKREYKHKFILNGFTFIALYYSISLLLSYIFLIPKTLPKETHFSFTSFLWSPELFLLLPLYMLFAQSSIAALIDAYVIVVFLPFFLTALVMGFSMGTDVRAVIPLSVVFIFVMYYVLFTLESVFLASFGLNNANKVIANVLFVFLIFNFLFYAFVLALAASYLGVYLGILFGRFAKSKRGSFVAFDQMLLPEIPISASTIFDLSSSAEDKLYEDKAVSLVLLNKRVEFVLRDIHKQQCPYFEDQRCAYLGYKTSGHRLQICNTEFWPVCRVYVFITQSKRILHEIAYSRRNGDLNDSDR